mmetsp:Transcript_51922/g.135512  ORF Transcript_51922/g.135512 Transcript_51922/m.135512 type:complete len:350 (+) Transcript_51922:593-1642(+)
MARAARECPRGPGATRSQRAGAVAERGGGVRVLGPSRPAPKKAALRKEPESRGRAERGDACQGEGGGSSSRRNASASPRGEWLRRLRNGSASPTETPQRAAWAAGARGDEVLSASVACGCAGEMAEPGKVSPRWDGWAWGEEVKTSHWLHTAPGSTCAQAASTQLPSVWWHERRQDCSTCAGGKPWLHSEISYSCRGPGVIPWREADPIGVAESSHGYVDAGAGITQYVPIVPIPFSSTGPPRGHRLRLGSCCAMSAAMAGVHCTDPARPVLSIRLAVFTVSPMSVRFPSHADAAGPQCSPTRTCTRPPSSRPHSTAVSLAARTASRAKRARRAAWSEDWSPLRLVAAK